MQEPTYPLTENQERELSEYEEGYNCQFESLAEWRNEVAQFGDASFQKPEIKPLAYPPNLAAKKTKADQYWKDLDLWRGQRSISDISDSEIPF